MPRPWLVTLVAALGWTGFALAEEPAAPPVPLPEFVRIAEVAREGRLATEIHLETSRRVPVQKSQTRTYQRDGQTFAAEVVVTEYVSESRITTYPSQEFKLVTLDGKATPWMKAKGKIVVLAPTVDGLSEEAKKLLAPETLVIVPTAPKADAAPPAATEPKKNERKKKA